MGFALEAHQGVTSKDDMQPAWASLGLNNTRQQYSTIGRYQYTVYLFDKVPLVIGYMSSCQC